MSRPEALIGASSSQTAEVLRWITLHGVSAEIIGPRVLARTLGIVTRAYPPSTTHAPPDIHITASRMATERNSWEVISDDRRYTAGSGVSSAARWSEWLLVSELLRQWTRFVHVHAGLVATPLQSALLIGRSGSGKSTTTVALALAGLQLYTDDVALIERTTMRPFCVPRPIKLDSIARRLLRPDGLVIPRGTWLGESIDRTVIPGLPPVEEPGPPLTTAIFFAEERQATPVLRRITNAEAVMRLILQSTSERFDESGPPEGAIALVNAVDCYELVAGDLPATVQTIRVLLDQ